MLIFANLENMHYIVPDIEEDRCGICDDCNVCLIKNIKLYKQCQYTNEHKLYIENIKHNTISIEIIMTTIKNYIQFKLKAI